MVPKSWRPYFGIAEKEGLEVLRPSGMGNEEDGISWVTSLVEGEGKRQNK